MFVREENEMFVVRTGRTEEGRGRIAVRGTWLEIPETELVRMLKTAGVEAESAGRHCSGRSNSR